MICIKSAVSSLCDKLGMSHTMTSWSDSHIIQTFDFGFSVGVGGVGVDFWFVAADFWPESSDT